MKRAFNERLLMTAFGIIAWSAVTNPASAAPARGILRTSIVPGVFMQGEPISVEIEPMPLPKAAKELAKIFGAPVKVVKTLEPSTLAVYAPSTTPEELRSKIAATYNATWTLREGVWYLDQTTEQMRTEAAIELERRKTAVRSMLEKARKATAAQKPFTDTEARALYNQLKDLTKNGIKRDDMATYQRLEQFESRGPEKRLMERLLSKLTDEMFLSVPEGERRVFALKPTAVQLRLNLDLREDVNRFIEEQSTWSVATGGQMITAGERGGAFGRLSANVKPIDQPVDNILISIQATPGPGFSVECNLVDPKGLFLSEGYGGTYNSEEVETYNIESLYGMGEVAKKHETKLSKEGLKFRRLLMGIDPVTKTPIETDAEFRERAAKLSMKDPLAYSTWDYLKQEAKDLNVSFVASLPDQSILISYGLLAFTRDPKTSGIAKKYFEMDVQSADDWVTISPANSVRHRRNYRDRSVLERQIALRNNSKNKSLETEADYALSLPNEDSYSLLDEFIRRFAINDEPIYNDRFFLRVYGLIPSSLKTPSASEKEVRLNQLPKEVQEYIFKRVYYGNRPTIQYEPSDGNFNEGKTTLFWNGVLKESTVSMPNGIPPAATMRITTVDDLVVKTSPKMRAFGMDQGELVSPEDLAQRVFQKSRPDLYPWVADDERYTVDTSRLRLYRKRVVVFLIDFKNDFILRGSITEATAMDSGTYTLDKLPTEFKKKYQETYTRIQNQAKNRKPDPGSGPKKDIPPGP